MVPLVGGPGPRSRRWPSARSGEPAWDAGASGSSTPPTCPTSRAWPTRPPSPGGAGRDPPARDGDGAGGGAVMDGAEWEQGFVDSHRPDAVRILDFPHAVGYLAQVGRGGRGADDPCGGRPGWTTQCHELHRRPARVLGPRALRALLVAGGGAEPARARRSRPAWATWRSARAQIRVRRVRGGGLPDRERGGRERQQAGGRGAAEGGGHALGAGARQPDGGAADDRPQRPLGGSVAAARAQQRQQARARTAARRRARRAGEPAPPAAVPAPVALPVPVLTPAPGELGGRDGLPAAAAPAPVSAAPTGPRSTAANHPWRRGHLSRRPASLARQTTSAEL